jgi:hypothetical protein
MNEMVRVDPNGVPLQTEKRKKPTARLREFNQFARDAETLRDYANELLRNKPGDWRLAVDLEEEQDSIAALAAEVQAGFATHDPPDLYQAEGQTRQLRLSYIAKRVGVMLAAFPNASPGSADGYAQSLIEHVAAHDGVNALALESTCRQVVETMKFPPSVAETLTLLDEQIQKWRGRGWMAKSVNNILANAIRLRREREAKEAIAEARRSATSAARRKQTLAQEIEETKAGLAKVIEETEAKIAKLVEQRAAAEEQEREAIEALEKLTEEPAVTP